MNHSRWLLLAAFLSLAGSWFGFVLTPQAQLGRLQPANLLGEPTLYPHARPGLARQGLEVYRANGCAECHTQQVRQSGTVCDVLLSAQGTNQAAVLSAVVQLKPGWSRPEARQWLSTALARGSQPGGGGGGGQGPQCGRRPSGGRDQARGAGDCARLGQTAQRGQGFPLRFPGGAWVATHRPGPGRCRCASTRCALAPAAFVCTWARGRRFGDAALPVFVRAAQNRVAPFA